MSSPARSDSPPPDALTDALASAIAAHLIPRIAELIAEHIDGAPQHEHAVDAAGIAQILGVSTPTVRRMDLPHVMCGEHRRYLPSVVLEHLRAQRNGGAR
jgi:hypothetical protein